MCFTLFIPNLGNLTWQFSVKCNISSPSPDLHFPICGLICNLFFLWPPVKWEMKPSEAKKEEERVQRESTTAFWDRWHDISLLALRFCLTDRLPKKGTEIPGMGIFLHRELEGQLSRIACTAKRFVLFSGTVRFGRNWRCCSRKTPRVNDLRGSGAAATVHQGLSLQALRIRTQLVQSLSLLPKTANTVDLNLSSQDGSNKNYLNGWIPLSPLDH